MSFNLMQFNELIQDITKLKPLEENLSRIVRTIENEFSFNSFGIFLKVPRSEIFRLKIGRNLSHTFAKNTIFTEGDPLIKDIKTDKLLDMRYPGTYSFEFEYSHLIVSALIFNEKLSGFIFLDRAKGFYESEELSKFQMFAALIAMVVFIYSQTDELLKFDIGKQRVPIYDHDEFLNRAKVIFQMMKRYKRYLTMTVFKFQNYTKLTRIYGEKKIAEWIEEIEKLFAENLRETDFIGQLEKDTIVILMPETSQKNAVLTSERLKTKLNDSNILKHGKTGWGICAISDQMKSLENLLKLALESANESARKMKGETNIIET